jgi:hypothetical protein
VTVIIWADPLPHLELLHRADAHVALARWDHLLAARGEPSALRRLLADAIIPPAVDGGRWRVELPSLARLSAAGVPRPRIGTLCEVLGSWTSPVTGTPTVRAEVLFQDGRVYELPPVGSS